jgi:hypothetical protein
LLSERQGALHFGQAFIIQDGGSGAHLGLGGGRADHIDAVERRFGCNALFIDAKSERAILDIQIEVLANLVFSDDLANADADPIASFELAAGNHVHDL